jgi:hypothetical protein
MIVPWVDLRDPNLPGQSQWTWAAAGNSNETGAWVLIFSPGLYGGLVSAGVTFAPVLDDARLSLCATSV